LLFATLLHTLAGLITGSIFKVRALLFLLGLIVVESIFLLAIHGSIAIAWGCVNITGIQIGYFVGILARGMVEQLIYSSPSDETRPHPGRDL
jgi:hypothetical protein